jgi:hypothetical protein
MNVVKFDIEIHRKRSLVQSDLTVFQLATKGFTNDLESHGNIATEMRNEWTSLEFPNVSALNSARYLVGYTTTNNVRVFVFEKAKSDVRGRNNVTFQVIAIGDAQVQKIFNKAIAQIRSVLHPHSLRCNPIEGTRIHIYPFNSAEHDIYSHSIVVRADLASLIRVGKFELIQWLFLIMVIFVTSLLLNASDDNTNKNLIAFYWSIIGSCVFVLVIDLFKYLIVPLMFQRNSRHVEVTDLSSVVETDVPFLFDTVDKETTLVIPEHGDPIHKD